jgi:hypothetical protein
MKKRTINTLVTEHFTTTSPRGAKQLNADDIRLQEFIRNEFNYFNADKKSEREKLQGFLVVFNVDGLLYAGCFPLELALERVKHNKGVDKILQPLGTRQVPELCEYIGTFEDLQAYKKKMRKTTATDNGTTAQKYICYLSGQVASLTTSIKEGGDLYKNRYGYWEVKYMTLGTSQGSAIYHKK